VLVCDFASSMVYLLSPSTPRTSGIEIQALFLSALKFGERLGFDVHDIIKKHERGISKFWNGTYFQDTLGDNTLRPNQLIAYNLGYGSDTILEELKRLETPYGISTIDPKDSRFKDSDTGTNTESYHNGDIWPWMTSEYITALVRNMELDKAWEYNEFHMENMKKGIIGSRCMIFLF